MLAMAEAIAGIRERWKSYWDPWQAFADAAKCVVPLPIYSLPPPSTSLTLCIILAPPAARRSLPVLRRPCHRRPLMLLDFQIFCRISSLTFGWGT